MENGFFFDKFGCNEKQKEDCEKIYESCKLSLLPKKRKARTENNDTKRVKKLVLEKIKPLAINNRKKKKMTKKKNNIANKKSLSSRTKMKKRPRTPFKEKAALDIFKKEKVEKIERRKEKKYKKDDNLIYNKLTVQNNFYKKYDNSNLLNPENIFEEIDRDEKLGKEEISSLQEMLCNHLLFDQGREQQEENEAQIQPQTQAVTILFDELNNLNQ